MEVQNEIKKNQFFYYYCYRVINDTHPRWLNIKIGK